MALVAGSGLAFGGCGGPTRHTIRVLVLGDSNVRLVTGSLQTAWARTAGHDRSYVPVIHGVNGAGACPNPRADILTGPPLWVPVIRSALATKRGSRRRIDAVVVQLGTNDALSARTDGPCLADYAGLAMAPVMDTIRRSAPDIPVVWVNQRTDYADASVAAAARTVNRELAGARSRWRHLVVADFDVHFRDHPGWFYTGSIFANVHLDPGGVAEYVRWLSGVLDRRVPA